jgi:hypothetical protein
MVVMGKIHSGNMWILVLITILNGEPSIEKVDGFSTFNECFENRDNLLVEYEAYDGFFPPGTQAICIKYK